MPRRGQRSFVQSHCLAYPPYTFRLTESSALHSQGTFYILSASDAKSLKGSQRSRAGTDSKADHNTLSKEDPASGYIAKHHLLSMIGLVKYVLLPSSIYEYHTAPAHTLPGSDSLQHAFLRLYACLSHIVLSVSNNRTYAFAKGVLFR